MRQTIGLGLISGTALLLEIALTRLLSTLYFPAYVFGVISVAILGIGLGAALGAWQGRLRQTALLAGYTAAAGLSAVIAVVYIVWVQAAPWHQGLFVLTTIPYIFIGLIITTIFSKQPDRSGRLYLADLAGAGAGVLLAIPIMNTVGPLNTLLLAAALFGLFAPIFSFRPAGLVVTIALGALFVVNLGQSWLVLDMGQSVTQKPLQTALNAGGDIIDTRWDAFARTDLIAPADGGPYQVFVDGAAGSIMPPVENGNFLINDIGFFPFATLQPQSALVIGPGGGLDVWFGLTANTRRITAVEVNPASVELVQQYADYNGGLYDLQPVDVVVDEGRSVLLREDEDYDLIFLSQVITETSERSGLALSENRVYTIEAFRDYFDHLTNRGAIALKLYDELTLTRALSTVLAALREDGLSDTEALNHIMVFIDPRVNPPVPLLIANKTAFSQEDSLTLGAIARERGFVPLFLPEMRAQPPLDAVADGERTYDEIIAESETNIAPSSDNQPYFFQFERGLPRNLYPAAALGGLLIVLGLIAWLWGQRRVNTATLRWSPLYFACLGIGFISIEVAAIHMTGLMLGHPTIAVTTIIAVFLLGGGIGSGIASGSLPVPALRIPPATALSVGIVGLMWVVIWQMFSPQLLGADQITRIGFTVLSLLPLTLLMGIPFPTGLRALRGADERAVAVAWAVNGGASVIGSIVAIIVSVLVGFNGVLAVGLGAYMLAGIVAHLGTHEVSA